MIRVGKTWTPPPKLTTTEWSNKYRYLAAESSALPGKYNTKLTPWIPGMHEALDDNAIWKVVCMKSAQIAWTDGVINNWLGRIIDIDPSPVIGLFSKADSAKEYAQEKLGPMVTATPRLRDKMDVTTSRKDGNRAMFKKFAGGFLKLVGSNSVSNVKSTPAPRVFVEEPDDAAINVGNQGDAIKLLEERTKTYYRRKVVFGGTPSVKDLSTIEDAYLSSDQRKFYVPCHDCEETHVLDWDNVRWDKDENNNHEIFGNALPETAVYACPHCGTVWNDHQKNRNVKKGEWVATAESRGVAGFYINELYSPFPGSRLISLVERYLQAEHKLEQGDDSAKIVFINSCLGKPYEYESTAPEVTELEDRAEEYSENTVPKRGLVITAGVDVQHDRFHINVWAYGRGEESFLITRRVIYAKTKVTDETDPAWKELESFLFSTLFEHESGFKLRISATTIDASDGQTSDQVYKFVRKNQRFNIMAGKGSSDLQYDKEIFSRPKQIETKGRRHSKAAKYGLQVFMIGTHKAKDLVIGENGRISLLGSGPGRMHWYAVDVEWYEQITSEIKAPHRSIRKKLVWQVRSGVRNEDLDCTVYALHAARSLKLNLMNDKQWDDLERKLMQQDLFSESGVVSEKAKNKKSRVINKGVQI